MDKDLREHMGALIRQGRQRLGYSQARFAALIGLPSRQAVARLERGRLLPSLPTLSRAATTLGIPLYRFLTPDDLVKSPTSLREDERVVMDALATLSDADVRLARRLVDAILTTPPPVGRISGPAA